MGIARHLLPMLVVLNAVCTTSVGVAQTHSWCITGDPLSAASSPVVAAVCNTAGYDNCCNTNGRWRLSCVQKAASYAMQQGFGDYCGRYAWAQGPITGTKMYFPRDFNLVALSGTVSTLQDVQGPIAAKGDITVSYFNLNHAAQEGIAVLGRSRVILANGTVHGQVLYGTSYSGGASVTFFDADPPTVFGYPTFPLDFDAASNTLKAASQSIKNFPSLHSIVDHMAVRFDGNDPELNVFDVAGADLKYATSYQFNVPLRSSIIVNVSGTNVTIQNAGFQGSYSAGNLLWNFPDATKLYLRSVGLPGSILAPKAAADFRYGSIRGTVVVASANPAYVELYSAPYQIPSCTGGLCLDPTWSCSDDTAIDDQGRAAGLKAEAGFFEISGGSYYGEVADDGTDDGPDPLSVERFPPTQRIWYAFQPAKKTPKDKPLAVLFNGGPGSATSHLLFSFNTATMTLDPSRTAGTPIQANIHSWTEFANLLYIDAPGTGFSYFVDDGTGHKDIGLDMDRDAGIFLIVVGRFLTRHPALLSSRTVVVGESYGGTRANLMLRHLYNYNLLENSSELYQDSQLREELGNYFLAAFSTDQPSLEQIRSRFSHLVLLQPLVVGGDQQDKADEMLCYEGTPIRECCYDNSGCRAPDCWELDGTNPAACDIYNCDLGREDVPAREDTAARNLTRVATLNTALGVDAATIDWMYAAARTSAYGRVDPFTASVESPIDMDDVFGELNSDDAYFVLRNGPAGNAYGTAAEPIIDPAPFHNSPGIGWAHGTSFAQALLYDVSAFVTDARYDHIICTAAIAPAIRELGIATSQSLNDEVQLGNIPRKGMAYLNFGDVQRSYFWPGHYEAGHTIPMRAPGELKSDVWTWYVLSPH